MILEIRDNCEHPYMLTFISFLNYKEWLMLSLKTYLGVMKLIQNFLNKNWYYVKARLYEQYEIYS